MKRLLSTVIVLALAASTGSALAKEKKRKGADGGAAMAQRIADISPGAGQAVLDATTGTWNAVVRAHMTKGKDGAALEFSGIVKKKWALFGRFVQEKFKGNGPDGAPYVGLTFFGYDNIRQEYQGVMMSTYGTDMTFFTGKADASGKVITFEGEETGDRGAERGRSKKFKLVLTIDGPDSHRLTHFYVGKKGETKAYEITYTRRR